MHRKVTITLDEQVYAGLHQTLAPGRISHFIESLLRPHVLTSDLESAYREMTQDEAREQEAIESADATIGDVADETRRGMV